MNFKRYTIRRLYSERKNIQAKIDGPENDGRITASGSNWLDHWMNTIDEINEEIKRRNSTGKLKMKGDSL